MSDIKKQILKQVEYYLSDKNLQHDKFFYDKVLKDPNGFIDINHFLNCNKIKSMDIGLEAIQEALVESEFLVMNDSKTGVKRKDINLPNFLGKKRKEGDTEKTEDQQKISQLNTYQTSDPILLVLSSDKDKAIKWKELVKRLKEELSGYEVVYCRFGFQKGHTCVFPSEDENQEINLNSDTLKDHKDKEIAFSSEKSFTMDDVTFKYRVADDSESKEFWKEHGGHYEFCLNQKIEEIQKKKGGYNNNIKKGEKSILKVPVTLGGEM